VSAAMLAVDNLTPHKVGTHFNVSVLSDCMFDKASAFFLCYFMIYEHVILLSFHYYTLQKHKGQQISWDFIYRDKIIQLQRDIGQ
jgi:hypothetical protein